MKDLSVTLALEEFGSWHNIRTYEPELYQMLKDQTTSYSYKFKLQGEAKDKINHPLSEMNYWRVPPVITKEQMVNWPSHFPQDREYWDFMVVGNNWPEEWEYYLQFGSESDDYAECDMHDYYNSIEENNAVWDEDEIQWAMIEQRYLRRLRRERSEDAHKRQEKKLTASTNYRRLNNGKYIDRQFGNIVEDKQALHVLRRKIRLVYRYDRTRRQRLYYAGIPAEEAINDYYWVENNRSQPNSIGRRLKKLRRQVYITRYEVYLSGNDQTERKLARLKRQLAQLEAKVKEMKENRKQNKFYQRFDRKINSNAFLNSFAFLKDEADEYLIRCNPEDQRRFDHDHEKEVTDKINAIQKRISILRSYMEPENTEEEAYMNGPLNQSLWDQIEELEEELEELYSNY